MPAVWEIAIRASFVVLAIAGLLAGAANSSGPSVAGISAADWDAAQVAEAIRFRSEFGFEHDLQLVERSFSDASAFDDTLWGVPLSTAEGADLARRIEVREAIVPASEYAVKQPEYAGVFIDQRRGGRPVFLFTEPVAQHESALRSLIPDNVAYEVLPVRRSMAELQTLRDQVEIARELLARQGVELILTAIKPSFNAVIVGVHSSSEATTELLVGTFGDGIIIEESRPGTADACTNISNCPPAKGGIKMYWALNSAKYCTTGWIGRRSDTSGLVIVTAGHCIELNGGEFDDWMHNGVKLGDALKETWANGALADVGLTSVVAASAPSTRNQVLATPNTGVRQITSFRVSGLQHEGDALCRVGATSGRTCGTLTKYDVTNPSCNPSGSDCRNILHTNETSFDSLGGDSGGPVFQYSPTPGYVIGYGTHVHSDVPSKPRSWFSAIGWGTTAYAGMFPYTYSVCVTSSC